MTAARSTPGTPWPPTRAENPFGRPWHPSEAYWVRRAYRMGLLAGRRGALTRQASEHRWWRRWSDSELGMYLDDWRDGWRDGEAQRKAGLC